MRIISVKRAIIILLMIGIVAGVAGCARWPYGPEPEPGTEYQLEITVEVAGEINTDEGIYYIVFDADSDSADGPGDDVNLWDDDYYYIKLGWIESFYFAQVKDDSESYFYGGSITGTNKFQITVAISDLGDPTKIDINVLTTDSDNHTYDSMSDGYFFISTSWGSSNTIPDSEDDSGEGGDDFDIIKVTASIKTL
ncbi:MAG: hypothetical protein WBC45_04295 [Atribacterota bacterium]